MKVKRVIVLLTYIVVIYAALMIGLNLWKEKNDLYTSLRMAIENGKQILPALDRFKVQYGKYPDETTAALVATEMDTEVVIDTKSSNSRFRQIIHADIVLDENIFHSKTSHTRYATDGAVSGNEAVSDHECGFAYVENVRIDDTIARPIAIAPASLTQGEFEYEPFRGKAVVVWTDGSVSSLPIDRSTNHVMLDGKNLFDPMHPIWGDIEPKLLMPEGK